MKTRGGSSRHLQTQVVAPLDEVIGEVLVRTIARYAQLQARVAWGLEGTRSFVEGLASEALEPAERARIAGRLYGRRTAYGQTGLFAWERDWYQSDLPPAPAKILLGGCGSGREALVLCDMGYEVFACEPVASLVQTAREALQGRASVWPLSYEEWASARLSETATQLFSRAPFDAVILGWGSLSHVLDDPMRERLFSQLVEFCPRGPILFSFMRGSPTSEGRMPRARGWGRRLGQLLARGRSVSTTRARERLLPHVGFVRCSSDEEISSLASRVGRIPKFHDSDGSPPHCTFLAPRSVPGAPA